MHTIITFVWRQHVHVACMCSCVWVCLCVHIAPHFSPAEILWRYPAARSFAFSYANNATRCKTKYIFIYVHARAYIHIYTLQFQNNFISSFWIKTKWRSENCDKMHFPLEGSEKSFKLNNIYYILYRKCNFVFVFFFLLTIAFLSACCVSSVWNINCVFCMFSVYFARCVFRMNWSGCLHLKAYIYLYVCVNIYKSILLYDCKFKFKNSISPRNRKFALTFVGMRLRLSKNLCRWKLSRALGLWRE